MVESSCPTQIGGTNFADTPFPQLGTAGLAALYFELSGSYRPMTETMINNYYHYHLLTGLLSPRSFMSRLVLSQHPIEIFQTFKCSMSHFSFNDIIQHCLGVVVHCTLSDINKRLISVLIHFCEFTEIH